MTPPLQETLREGGGSTPTRPALRWHGGKWKLAEWIIGHFPAHRVYVEPFGGAASILLRKPRSYAEIYNDLDGEVVNFFRVLRSERARVSRQALRLTAYAREEYELAQQPAKDEVERARRICVRSYMGHGSDASSMPSGFRANSNRSGTTPAHDWVNYPSALEKIIARLIGVVIENRPATRVMLQHDAATTLHYLDPPYLHETRKQARPHNYTHEMTDEGHVELLEAARKLKGVVMISGYAAPLYDEALSDWARFTKETHADGAKPRTEVLWVNRHDLKPMAIQSEMFAEVSA